MRIELEQADIDRLTEQITKKVLESLKATPLSPAPADTVFTVEGLAKYLDTTPKWVYNHVHELPHFKLDGLLRFRKAAIDRMFEEGKAKPSV